MPTGVITEPSIICRKKSQKTLSPNQLTRVYLSAIALAKVDSRLKSHPANRRFAHLCGQSLIPVFVSFVYCQAIHLVHRRGNPSISSHGSGRDGPLGRPLCQPSTIDQFFNHRFHGSRFR